MTLLLPALFPKGKRLDIWIADLDTRQLFIPDARKFWIRPSIRYLSKYLADNLHDDNNQYRASTLHASLPWNKGGVEYTMVG